MSLKSDIISAMVITWVSALLALIARVFARRMTKVPWWYDDYLCVGAFVSLVCEAFGDVAYMFVGCWYWIQCCDDIL